MSKRITQKETDEDESRKSKTPGMWPHSPAIFYGKERGTIGTRTFSDIFSAKADF